MSTFPRWRTAAKIRKISICWSGGTPAGLNQMLHRITHRNSLNPCVIHAHHVLPRIVKAFRVCSSSISSSVPGMFTSCPWLVYRKCSAVSRRKKKRFKYLHKHLILFLTHIYSLLSLSSLSSGRSLEAQSW